MSTDLLEVVSTPTQPPADPVKKPAARQAASLFRVVWRWHFYAGVLVAPFIMVIAVTGAIYLFSAEISDWVNRDLRFVHFAEDSQPASCQALIASAEEAVAGGKAERLMHSADPRRTVSVAVAPAAAAGTAENFGKATPRARRTTTVYVNPYTAAVHGHSAGRSQLDAFFRSVLDLHRSLWIGNTGRVVVELATTWTLVLMLSGVFLWWPRRAEKRRGVWTARWSAKGYTRWRDMHALAGVYTIPVCLIILVTGLFYTLIWGESFHLVSRQFFVAANTLPAAHGETTEQNAEPEPYVPPRFSVQQALDTAREKYPKRDITLTFPKGSSDHYEVAAINDYARGTYGAMNSTGFKLHRDTGELLELSDLANNERYWWHTWAYPLHVGSVLGPLSKVPWLFACLVLFMLPASGMWMWWKRRPAGRSGLPRATTLDNVPATIWILIVALAFLLPVFGLSVLVIATLDWLVGKLTAVAIGRTADQHP